MEAFKPKQWVLCRDENGDNWELDIFAHYQENTGFRFRCVGEGWKQCIPYEGNEHLLGTADPFVPEWIPKRGDFVAVRDSEGENWRLRVCIRVNQDGTIITTPFLDKNSEATWQFYTRPESVNTMKANSMED